MLDKLREVLEKWVVANPNVKLRICSSLRAGMKFAGVAGTILP